jgi:hypothetical protein
MYHFYSRGEKKVGPLKLGIVVMMARKFLVEESLLAHKPNSKKKCLMLL